jgi:NADH-quinone oxidoreductase subunit A
MTPIFAALALFIFVVLFGMLIVFLGSLFGPKNKGSKVKSETYECGLPEQLTGHTKIPVKFYLTAILFILFDIEIIFMYPWAVSLIDGTEAGAGVYMLAVMGVFLAIFIYGLFWEIKSRALEWE